MVGRFSFGFGFGVGTGVVAVLLVLVEFLSLDTGFLVEASAESVEIVIVVFIVDGFVGDIDF